jgi:starch phosphorylase
MSKALERGAGILLPISSLPSPYGIGTMGRDAYDFVDMLKRAGQKYWQVLPIGPTSFGDSPYQSFSAFAGNPYFIDLDTLIAEGLLKKEEVESYKWADSDDEIDYARIYRQRFEVLRKAFGRSEHKDSRDYVDFIEENEQWIDDYALYMAIKADHNNREWLAWEPAIKKRKPEAMAAYREKLGEDVEFYKFLQFKFYEQWMPLKEYANRNGISIIGDIPIYVALDSADVWANTDQFQLSGSLAPAVVAGCPPDMFSSYGQKWGNPIYDWDVMEKDDFAWWKKRIAASAKLYDVIRIDHFIGIVRYYSIPANGEPKDGYYRQGPGKKLIDAIDSAIGSSKVIAEDLGVVVPEVQKLVKESGYPGMKVLEFAFDGNTANEYLPHNHAKNYVAYIGTHDNDMLKSYISGQSEDLQEYMMKYLMADSLDDVAEKMIHALYMSSADTVILQMQDILGKDNSARMNYPSTLGGNWKWRLTKGATWEFTQKHIDKLRDLTRLYGRNRVKTYICKEDIMLKDICMKKYNKEIKDCTNEEIYFALLDMTKKLADGKVSEEGQKKVYYISAEFLIGKLLSNNLINLGVFDEVKQVLAENGKSIYDIEEVEPEPSLGNGGLGRLAACFLDSMATLGLHGDGIGLNYHMGLFKQVFENNYQKETANPWIEADSWLEKTDVTNTITFGNLKVQSRMYDIDVTGYENRTNKLHLFDIESVDESIMEPDGISFDKTDIAKNLTLCLYPDDSDEAGNLLRIYQQYFMVANGAKLILDEAKAKGSNLHDLADYAAVQINDTHPSMVIPEFIRLLTAEGISFDEATEIVTEVCAYTNHTILAEALEKWPLAYLEKVVPQLVPIIKKLDEKVRNRYKDESVYIIDKDQRVHMAHIDIHYSHSVNGVAYLHTEILKDSELNNFYKIYPEKFNNKTNGITFRRWLLHCNEQLAAYITELIGDGYKKNAEELNDLAKFYDDDAVLGKIMDIKKQNKAVLKDYLKETQNIDIDENSIFDIQVKRLHEYKRQQMNALWVIHKYFDIKAGNLPKTPVTVIFGAKAAPAYTIAKDIIHLILCLQQLIDNDPEVSPYLKVVMIENYNVSKAAKIIPACDISEQISLASKEASGTGNMKFMLNGALTLGTRDGANVEIGELVGEDNIYFFGESSEAVIDHYAKADYVSKDYYEQPEIKKLVDFIVSDELLEIGQKESLERLHNELIVKDWFMTLLDVEDYIKTKEGVLVDYEDRKTWAKKALVNISKAGFFSSDRTIAEYNKDIWRL